MTDNTVPTETNFEDLKKKYYSKTIDRITAILTFFLTFCLIEAIIQEEIFAIWAVTPIYICFFILATVYIVSKTKTFHKDAVFPGLLAIASSFVFLFHADSAVILVFFMLIYLSGSYVIKLTGSNVHSFSSVYYLLDVLRDELLLPLKFIPECIVSFFRPAPKKKEANEGGKKKINSALIGILLAVPVLFLVIPFLIKSDFAFESLLGNVWNTITKAVDFILGKLDLYRFPTIYIGTIISAPYIYSVMFCFANCIIWDKKSDTSTKLIPFRKADRLTTAVFLGIICSVYAVYLLSQFGYVFTAFTGKLPFGTEITVIEYARRGFFEMEAIAVINLIIIGLTVLFSKRKENNHLQKSAVLLCSFLCVFTILFSASSLSKVLIYINAYGLTAKRIMAVYGDIVLMLAFACILLRLHKEKFPYMKIIISSACVLLCVITLLGTENIASRYNTNAYLKGKLPDFSISDVGYNGYGAWGESLLKIAKSDTKQSLSAKLRLQTMYESMDDENGGHIKIRCNDERKFKKLVEENKDLIYNVSNETK